MYAVIKQGGRQYKVSPGDVIQIQKIEAEKGDDVELSNVLMLHDGSDLTIGAPSVDAAVKAKVLRQDKGKKIIVFKFKRRKGYSKKQGHRQLFTEVRITGLTKDGKELSA